jgi:hypothetical protein
MPLRKKVPNAKQINGENVQNILLSFEIYVHYAMQAAILFPLLPSFQ